MSLPVLSTVPYISAPPVTPTIPHDPQTNRSFGTTKHHVQNNSELPDLSWTAPFRDGLPTPPSDMNSVAYNVPSYGGKPERYAVPVYSKVPAYPRVNTNFVNKMVQHTQTQTQHQLPVQDAPDRESDGHIKDREGSTPSYLQIPPSINNGKGNLPDFAAQMTCLFWFESSAKLKSIEDRSSNGLSLSPEAIPTIGFQKWVSSILSTTQVSQNVILLALLFIYRLKKFNPRVRGKKGSEYRLMTIALMLGNKFLDDNTYTNKTWAEVSRISVQEIHVMEVEFLSNLRYNLYASKKEWAEWHVKLGLFADFFNNAPLSSESGDVLHTPVLRLSPNFGPIARAQLSPISSARLPSPTAEPLSSHSWAPVNVPPYAHVAQVVNEPLQTSSRKRRYEEPAEEQHPSKKIAVQNTIPLPASSLPSSIQMSMPALPPMLAPTSAPPQQSISGPVPRLPHTFAPSVPASLPQLSTAPGRPTMPPVYNPTTWAPQIPVSAASQPVTNGVVTPALSLPDPSRRNNSPFAVTSATVSPAVSAYALHTPQTHLSPSFFLANRNSPYRPVRSVNTLLIPPPSASLESQRSIPFDHMHYQPLGKSVAERKTGLLPYLHHEAWPQGTYIPPNFFPTPHYAP
ncbi:cyclin-domain-containing protein [Aspergillus pseudoustus]|uniref:Cyclin-domain-containing protein n=1 Tax=Aspergillus pseudoustus TaxID=1810923 RepID=A0ABR4JPN9_9EURO